MCSPGVNAGGFNWFPQQKLKETHPKKILIDCCFWDVVSVISDESYDEGFTGDDIFEKCERKHLVFSDINKISDYAGIEEKEENDE